jgi:hypothetical protein
MKNTVFLDVVLEAIVRTDVSQELVAPIVRFERISGIGTTLAETSKPDGGDTSDLTRAT